MVIVGLDVEYMQVHVLEDDVFVQWEDALAMIEGEVGSLEI